MTECIENDIEFLTVEMFEESYNILRRKPGEKYKFIMNGGHVLKMALLKICQSVWQSERLPQSWEKTTLVQLYKGKGKRNNLDNMRHIHMKAEFPKFFGHLVVSAVKGTIVQNMSKFQIATKPGHRAQENLYVLKSVIWLYSMLNIGLVLQNWDLSKFFDKESLFDCLGELYKKGIKGKMYRLLYALNKNTKFSILTPVGVTEEVERGPGVGQGTGEGALISSLNLDSGVREYFSSSDCEVSYGPVQLAPILFKDDVARLALNIRSAQQGNIRMETMAETKLLDYNLEKSTFMILGNKKSKEKIENELSGTSLLLCGRSMVQVKEAKYLGDWLSCEGLSDSVTTTVNKRLGISKLTIYMKLGLFLKTVGLM